MTSRRAVLHALLVGALLAPTAVHAQLSGTPNASGPFSAVAQARRDSIVARARSQLGATYRLGASTPGRAFDCSGFVRFVLGAFGMSLPRTSTQQARVGEAVPRDLAALKPGDVLTFGRNGRTSHVGIYVGGGNYVHASSYKRGVVEAPLARDAKRGWWMGARRMLTDSASAP